MFTTANLSNEDLNPRKGLMASAEKTLQIIYYVVLIILVVAILFLLFWPHDWSKSNHNRNDLNDLTGIGEDEFPPTSDEAIDDMSCSPDKTSAPRQYSYRLSQVHLSLSDQPRSKESTLSYQEFLEIMFHQEFIQQYVEALRVSFTEKRRIYQKKLRHLVADLKGAQVREGSTPGVMTHDSNLDRMRRAKAEISQVVEAINGRLKSLSTDQVRRDFIDAVYNCDNGIESLIGRDDIKNFLALQIYTFARNPKIFFTNFQNMTIYGCSGVGKTKLAETIGYVYAKSGILARRKVRPVTKQEFTTSYVNESSQLTRELLLSTLEGVLFIDEAYDLMPPSSILGRGIDHGSEAVTEMVNFLDKHIGLSVVIAAGYEDEMEERFIGANQGIDRRFPHKIRLCNYNSKQLTDILLKFINKSAPELEITNREAGYLYTLIDFLYEERQHIFDKQAGDMLILSGFLIRSIYGSRCRRWAHDETNNNDIMLLDGVNDYLSKKGISITLQV